MKDWPRSTCPHSWLPLGRYPQLAICFYCEAPARWSTVLGCYIRLIPESHTADGGLKHKPGQRAQNRRPTA